MEAAEILMKPFARQVVPQPDGLFKAEILEFPGCFAVGESPAAALVTLEEVAVDWIEAALAQGQDIPEPTESAAYSGKFVVRMSKTLHRKAAQFALRDGVSLNQFVVNCVAEHVGMLARPLITYAQPTNILTLQLDFNTMPRLPGVPTTGSLVAATRADYVHVPVPLHRNEGHA
jgi:predicted HicB family RNase H-like nuclease